MSVIPWPQLQSVDAEILDIISSMGFSHMTPVQSQVIPKILLGKDVVVEAVTGSGKTLCFLVPIVQKVQKLDPALYALILCPTRELATQIHKVLELFNTPCLLVLGGECGIEEDILRYKTIKPKIIIGTPGRTKQLLLNKSVDTKSCKFLIFDEADKLLDPGFKPSVDAIIKMMPKFRQTCLFSATMTDSMHELQRTGLRNAIGIIIRMKKNNLDNEEQRTPNTLEIKALVVDPHEKLDTLLELFSKCAKTIVFFATCSQVQYFSKLLIAMKMPEIHCLHGHQSSKKRINEFRAFCESKSEKTLLLTTDVAARGIDLPDVDRVIMFDPPIDPNMFSHRCGRAGRAGRIGFADVLISAREAETYVPFLEHRKIPISVEIYTPQLNLYDSIVTLVREDRDLMECGVKAYVSFYRAYSKHQLHYIFQIKEFEFIEYAKLYALQRAPVMPELRANQEILQKIQEITLPRDQVDLVEYKDKVRENARQNAKEKNAAKLEQRANERKRRKIAAIECAPWSKKKAAKERKRARKAVKELKKNDQIEPIDESSESEKEADPNLLDCPNFDIDIGLA